jgi:hypothetical protein
MLNLYSFDRSAVHLSNKIENDISHKKILSFLTLLGIQTKIVERRCQCHIIRCTSEYLNVLVSFFDCTCTPQGRVPFLSLDGWTLQFHSTVSRPGLSSAARGATRHAAVPLRNFPPAVCTSRRTPFSFLRAREL